MKQIKGQILWISILLVVISACDKNRVYDDFITIPESGWYKDSLLHFEVPVSDTLSNHNLTIKVRNETTYSYRNLWLFIEIIQPSGETVKDSFEVALADPAGKWLGKGFSGYKTYEAIYRRNVYFPASGNYQINILQGMRQENLKGIRDIGFRVEKNQ